MRLIDADRLVSWLYKKRGEIADKHELEPGGYVKIDAQHLIDAIATRVKNEPIAYDVDKVVEKLDKASDYYECEVQGREHVQMVDLLVAIEIVKAGVTNE